MEILRIRDEGGAVSESPQEFRDHINHMAVLFQRIENPELRHEIVRSIEVLVENLRGPWVGCAAVWPDPIPDDLEDLL